MKWDGVNSVFRVLLVIMLLLVFGPFLLELSFVGDHHQYHIACQSNLKQLGLAMEQYAQDSDGNPPAYQQSTSGPGWRETIYPFVKSVTVYQCPSDKNASMGATPSYLPRSYGANLLRGKNGLPLPLTAPIPGFPSISDPSQTIRIVDMRGYDGAEWNMTNPTFLPNTGRELYAHVRRHIFYEHPGGTLSCLFADGHVKSLKPAVTLAPVNLWTRDNAPFAGQDLQNARAILTHAEDE